MPSDLTEIKLDAIIPVFNSMSTLPKLLDSLKQADTRHCHFLFVDDGSTDGSPDFIQSRGFEIHRMSRNSGPAAARNEGMRLTNAPIVLFADSDIVVYTSEAFQAVIKVFQDHPQVNSVASVSLPCPENQSFLAKYTALNEFILYNRYIKERREIDFWPDISTRFGAFRRELLEKIKGFDTRFPNASVEDEDLFYRIQAEGHHGYLLTWLQIGHHWPSRWIPLIKAWMIRAYLWSRLFESRKSFDEVFTTRNEAYRKIADCVAILVIISSLVVPSLLIPALLLEGIVLASKISMFHEFKRYHGLATASGAILMNQFNSVVLALGGIAAIISRPFRFFRSRS